MRPGGITAATFRDQEDAAGYLTVLRETVRRHGVPLALYRDRHTLFETPRGSPRRSRSNSPTRGPDPARAALAELGITSIAARSPQAKGRIERAGAPFPGPPRGRAAAGPGPARSRRPTTWLSPAYCPVITRWFARPARGGRARPGASARRRGRPSRSRSSASATRAGLGRWLLVVFVVVIAVVVIVVLLVVDLLFVDLLLVDLLLVMLVVLVLEGPVISDDARVGQGAEPGRRRRREWSERRAVSTRVDAWPLEDIERDGRGVVAHVLEQGDPRPWRKTHGCERHRQLVGSQASRRRCRRRRGSRPSPPASDGRGSRARWPRGRRAASPRS